MIRVFAAGRRASVLVLLPAFLLFITALTVVPVVNALDDQKQSVDETPVVEEAPLLSPGFNGGIVTNTLSLIQILFPHK